MPSKLTKARVGRRLMAAFEAAGATEVAPDILLPAETLLDLYGEDIRARAYVTTDPIRGEMMLRPDFTVPVTRMHMADGPEPARYCYLGEVFRKQDSSDALPEVQRDIEYFQAGFEMFSRDPSSDAEIFALFYNILQPYRLDATIGDMQLLLDAVKGLPISGPRRAALVHHIWRPARFAALLARFSAASPRSGSTASTAPWTGLRSRDEMEARQRRLQEDADQPPLSDLHAAALRDLFAVKGKAPAALEALRELTARLPSISEAVTRLEGRLAAMEAAGIETAALHFDASHGRRSMEYYDGMTFSFTASGHRDWPPVAQGGRYDALTAVLGEGRAIPAVGGIIRPGLIAELEAGI